MLQPKKTKFRKAFRPNPRGYATTGNVISFGDFGLQGLERCWLTARQIESARKVIVREIKRKGKLWIRVFPSQPVTMKPNEVGMGKGKGDVDHYIAPLRPGIVLFELGGVDEVIAREAFKKAAQKLPIKAKFIQK
jgi:large subunit ribosomal protein L16